MATATGKYEYHSTVYTLVDLPGTYSLMAHSAEEEVARDFICFGEADAVILVCDATCLERNLNLVLQTLEITSKAVICVNLMDEAEHKKIHVDLKRLEEILGVPVAGCAARSGKGLDGLMELAGRVCREKEKEGFVPVRYSSEIEEALEKLACMIDLILPGCRSRFVALKVLTMDETFLEAIEKEIGYSLLDVPEITETVEEIFQQMEERGHTLENWRDEIVKTMVSRAEEIGRKTVTFKQEDYQKREKKIDRIVTGKYTGIPLMLLLLGVIFWLTITGANYPSALLSKGLFWIQDQLLLLAEGAGMPSWLSGVLILGAYRVMAWVVSVMLPPMAIFFPLFTLLEDLGYLPRVAFNLDHHFKKACTCGKQCLSMCMGLGCNAAGVVGCRIIDSPRERLIAVLTNNFMPCNGRFPTLIAMITMFFAASGAGILSGMIPAVLLTGVIVLGVFMTFFTSRLLSKTFLSGVPSSFTLELPPYRRPQVGKVLVRSILDRTLFVLGRAIVVAVPAGVLIWLMANVTVGGDTLLAHCSGFLDPLGRLLGMDGVILLAFILGFPANEIVIPIIIMAYMAGGSLMELENLAEMKALFVANGWTWVTAACTMLFCLMHWPCSTTCLTIHKETKSMKWTLMAMALPTAMGMLCCFLLAAGARLFQALF